MFANPYIQAFIEQHQIGGRPPATGGGVRGSNNALAEALANANFVRPETAQTFQAPAIQGPLSTPQAGTGGGPRELLGQSLGSLPSISASAGGLGANALTSGLSKLGTGIDSAISDFAAKQKLQQGYADAVNQAPARPGLFLAPPRPAPFGSPPSTDAGLPGFAAGSGISAGTPSAPLPGFSGSGLKTQIAQHIADYARSIGYNPNTALGIAYYEGLNRANPLASNPDGTIGGVTNTAVGPFQFGTAGLGGQLGITSATPWQTQVEKAVDYMAAHGTGPWNSVGDIAGTHGNNSNTGPITARGAAVANQLGLTTPAQDAAQDAAPPQPSPSGGVQQGIYNGQPYTYQTQPALGQQGMNAPADNSTSLAMALAGQGDPNAAPLMGPGVVDALLANFGLGGFGAAA